jgi:hypothetical protein
VSFDLRKPARKTRLGNLTAKSILLLICDYASVDGYTWLSIERIAQELDGNKRTVQRVFQVFAAIGLIELRSRGPKRSPGIQLNLGRLGTNLIEEYALESRAAQGKMPGARCRRRTVSPRQGSFFDDDANVAETRENVAETRENVAETFLSDSLKGVNASREPQGEPYPRAATVFTKINVQPMNQEAAAELRAAVWLFEELAVPSDFAMRDLGAQAIRMQAAEWGGIEPAARRILEAARRAKANGFTKWCFWFKDQGYLEQMGGMYAGGCINRAQQRTNGNLAALATFNAWLNNRGDADGSRGDAASSTYTANLTALPQISRQLSH